MKNWTSVLPGILKSVRLYSLLPIIVAVYFTGCDFFDKSEQPMGTGDTDLLSIDWDRVDDYVTCSLYLNPDETGTHMTAEFVVTPYSSIADFVDLSSTTFDMGGEELQIPISSCQLISDTVTTSKRYRTIYDSLPFFEMGERFTVRVSSPFWGISEKSFTYPELLNIFDSSYYLDSTGEFVDTIIYNFSIDYGTSGYILKTTYLTNGNGVKYTDVDSITFRYYEQTHHVPVLSQFKSTALSIDSIGIVYALTSRDYLNIVNYRSGFRIQTQPSKEFIIKPNKRNK